MTFPEGRQKVFCPVTFDRKSEKALVAGQGTRIEGESDIKQGDASGG